MGLGLWLLPLLEEDLVSFRYCWSLGLVWERCKRNTFFGGCLELSLVARELDLESSREGDREPSREVLNESIREFDRESNREFDLDGSREVDIESSREFDRLSSLEVDRDGVLLNGLMLLTGLMDDLLGLIDNFRGLTDCLLGLFEGGLLLGDLFGLDLEGLRDFIDLDGDLESALEFGLETDGKFTEALECDRD